ncbi:MAG: c-type cytochrome [Burkholderiales bacterium]
MMIRRALLLGGMLLYSAGIALAQIAPSKGDPIRGETKVAACGSCHGEAGRAPLAGLPLLAAQPEQYLTLQMILLREGLRDIPQMAPFMKGLTDRDVTDIAAYYTRQPLLKNDAPRDTAIYGRGAALSKGMGCGSCHRADYAGQNQVPRIAGQREDYLAHALKAYRDNKRVGTDTNMNGLLGQMTDADAHALAHYFAQQ